MGAWPRLVAMAQVCSNTILRQISCNEALLKPLYLPISPRQDRVWQSVCYSYAYTCLYATS